MVALETPVCAFDWKPAPFDLPGVDGRRYTLRDVRGENGTLVMFICNHCPYVRAIIDRLVDHVSALQKLGVGPVAINSNDTVAYPQDSFDNMIAFAREHGFTFPYLLDETQEVAQAYGAVCTPDFFGFNADLGLQYRGRLDASKKEAAANAEPELYNAMKQVAETGRGPAEQIPSMGCSIKWKAA